MKHYKIQANKINKSIEKLLNRIDSHELKKIVTYALDGGKRLRSVVTIVMGKTINKNVNLEKLAISMELLHNCSLIIDDLPCMDNDKIRRGKKTLHCEYGETKSQLVVSYLLDKSLKLLQENIRDIGNIKKFHDSEYVDKISIEIYKNINYNLGILGASGGQFIDTSPINSFINKNEYKNNYENINNLLNLVHQKTTTFFEISFVSAYLLAGGDITKINTLKKFVRFFGLAFQISDDFEDIDEDIKRIKDSNFNPNLICKYGEEKIIEIFNKSINCISNLLNELNIQNIIFDELIEFLKKRVSKNSKFSIIPK